MADQSVKVIVPGRPVRPKAALISESGRRWEFLFAPQGLTRRPGGVVWKQTERPGATPLLTPSGRSLASFSTDFLMGYPDPQRPIEPEISALTAFAYPTDRVRLSYGSGEQGWFHITDLQVEIVQRTFYNEACRAQISLELTSASDLLVLIHPIAATSSAQVAPVAAPAASVAAPATPAGTRTVTVNAGDTLSSIAARELGNASRWRELADLNGISNPNRVSIGTVLKLP